MAASLSGKRPWTEKETCYNFIDLTTSDDERPIKRPRSESSNTPPLATSTNSRPPPSKLIPSQINHTSYRDTNTLRHLASPSARRVDSIERGSRDLPDGVRSLSLRPPPKPQSNGHSRKSRSLSVISIHGSEPDTRPRSPVRGSPRGTERSSTPIWHDAIEPITFDPSVPDTTHSSEEDTELSKWLAPPPSSPPVRDRPQVNVPTRDQLNTPKSISHNLLSSQQSVTSNKSRIRINVPPHPAQKAAQERDAIRRIIQDLDYFRDNATDLFNLTSVKPFDNEDSHMDKVFKKAAQKKHKSVKREQIALDFGTDSDIIERQTSIIQNKSVIVHPRQQTRLILSDRFKRPNGAPLTFENRRNPRQLNGKFQFVSNYVLSKKVKKKNLTALPARMCQCWSCGIGCPCLDIQHSWAGADGSLHTVSVQPYVRRLDGRVGLSDDFIDNWSETVRITECGELCGCPSSCVNRVVQKGRTLPLQIFETKHCGFGVRSSHDIYRGQFIDLYLGEVLTTDEVAKRENAVEEDTPSYVLSLDVYIQDEPSMLHIDGENFGSIMRFVNHSCEPNCTTLPVVLSQDTKHIYHVGFFAIKDIPKGTELTIDYEPGLSQEESDELDVAVVICRCGSAKCRKRLWRPGREKRGRRRILPSKDDD